MPVPSLSRDVPRWEMARPASAGDPLPEAVKGCHPRAKLDPDIPRCGFPNSTCCSTRFDHSEMTARDRRSADDHNLYALSPFERHDKEPAKTPAIAKIADVEEIMTTVILQGQASRMPIKGCRALPGSLDFSRLRMRWWS